MYRILGVNPNKENTGLTYRTDSTHLIQQCTQVLQH